MSIATKIHYYFTNENYEELIALLDKIAKAKPKSKKIDMIIDANLILGDIYSHLIIIPNIKLDFDKAIIYYTKAKELAFLNSFNGEKNEHKR